MKHPIGKRLLSAAEFVRQGAYFADIGTDHAYLPLFLLEGGKIERAVCSDINAGPLETAKRNAEEYGLSDRIIFRLTSGAEGLSDMGITDYAICGMGGELIAEIIESAPHLKDGAVRLIHGKGTGALKNALWQRLKHDRRVASFRIAAYGEGDGGVTVVELK